MKKVVVRTAGEANDGDRITPPSAWGERMSGERAEQINNLDNQI
jgi:hypothetical protein